jgi:hypothetical protein
MAIDLTGISNQNEFYTQHYLSAIFEQDLKERLQAWATAADGGEQKAPYDRLAGLRRDYFALQERLQKKHTKAERLEWQRPFLQELLGVLGYAWRESLKETEDGQIPVVGEVCRTDGAPWLWMIATTGEAQEASDPLSNGFIAEQYIDDLDPKQRLLNDDLESLITRQIFTVAEPPRWLLVFNLDALILIDRSKWSEKRLLRFDLKEILERRESSTLKAMAALLHREHVCPDSGTSLLDTLDENSHKHAFAVSEDLKYAAREAVELIGNEAVWYLKEKRKEKVYDLDANLAKQLSEESLRYLYRLLFLFYLEARPEKLGYLPMKNEAYRTGYSLDSLRELEMTPLQTPEAQNGYFLDDSIRILFTMITEGFEPKNEMELGFDGPLHDEFKIDRVESHLFDPARTPLLDKVRIRNAVWQQIIQLLSLTKAGTGRNQRRGRVSYAQLGIIQLGAVYEGLLSYSGFFAETDLYEVKKSGDEWNPLHQAFFVKAEELENYADDERVYTDGTKNRLMKHERGAFIYRLAGRAREKSASYYTPTSLTQCLVKYALKELIGEKEGDTHWKTADEILKLTVCEPAMGSAAFLNEAVNQLADAYLRRKQKELDQYIPHDQMESETQKIRMLLADNNVFGVDLNPVAVELAEISLWLNSIHAGNFVPWFGFQLQCGNSLIGARRQVYASDLLTKQGRKEIVNHEAHKKHENGADVEANHGIHGTHGRDEDLRVFAPSREEPFQNMKRWLDGPPERVLPGTKRESKSVYHFLLPDPGMADYGDKVIKQMAPDEIKAMREWRKEFCKPFSDADVRLLEKLSLAVDRLWEEHTRQLRSLRADTTDTFPFFGHPEIKKKETSLRQKDKRLKQEIFSEGIKNSSPYRRLKLAMDYGCALWFWPIQQAELLPTRDSFLLELQFILEGSAVQEYGAEDPKGQMHLFAETAPRQQQLELAEKLGYVDVDRLCNEFPRLELVQQIADRQRFLHWELEFADLFADRGGFDLVVGNPPWIKVEWNESGLLSDYQPRFEVQKLSASKVADLREETIEQFGLRDFYFEEYTGQAGTQNFLNALCNYPLLKNVQTNLYKCFLPQAWMIASPQGVSGFVHPEGVYDDPKGGGLRAPLYHRLRFHAQFDNELKLFSEVHHCTKFSLNVFGGYQNNPQFIHLANLFSVSTIDESMQSTSPERVGGIKDNESNWNTKGHPDRVIHVGEEALRLFAKLYDEPGTPFMQARLPAVHSIQVMEVLKKFAAHPKRLGDLAGHYYSCEMWHETNAQKDRTIRRETQFPSSPESLILSGPHFFVGNPCYKTPRDPCVKNSDYDVIDLTHMPADYLPRTNYVPDCTPTEYRRRTPSVPWDPTGETKVTDYYRLIYRGMLSQSGERTLTGAIVPKGVGHIHGAQTTAFQSIDLLLKTAVVSGSLSADFFVKTTGKSNLHYLWESLPVFDKLTHAVCRYLLLGCLSKHYSDLWTECWNPAFTQEQWAKEDPRLPSDTFSKLTSVWSWETPLRTDYARRQALVEIDVLVARALGLTVDELCAIYRIQFPVLRQNENDTWYDQNGRIVFTCSKGLPGVGFSRPEWNEIKDLPSGTVTRTVVDSWLPEGGSRFNVEGSRLGGEVQCSRLGGEVQCSRLEGSRLDEGKDPRERVIEYVAPFDKCDREQDYRTVWAAFDEREKG